MLECSRGRSNTRQSQRVGCKRGEGRGREGAGCYE